MVKVEVGEEHGVFKEE